MMDSAAEVSEYLLAYPTLSFHAWAVIMLIGILILLAYPLLSFYPPVVNEAEGNETSSRLPATIVLPAGSQRSGRGEHASHPPHEVHRLSPPNPVCPTRESRHRPAWAHHPQA